jgi:hypothetical protein
MTLTGPVISNVFLPGPKGKVQVGDVPKKIPGGRPAPTATGQGKGQTKFKGGKGK